MAFTHGTRIEFLSTPSARRATCFPLLWASTPGNFYPRPPRGGRPSIREVDFVTQFQFLSTPSARRATHRSDRVWHDLRISIHALREEGDRVYDGHVRYVCHFYPRPPRGGRPGQEQGEKMGKNFYPRPPRGGRRGRCRCSTGLLPFLSTPSARRATALGLGLRPRGLISIHALREEGDMSPRPSSRRVSKFLSTPSARRATAFPPQKLTCDANFYPRPPRGGRHSIVISIEPPTPDFYPRPPRGGRPVLNTAAQEPVTISIHALREEGDVSLMDANALAQNFYPRPPRGGRHGF